MGLLCEMNRELGGAPGDGEGLTRRRSWKGDQVAGLGQDDDQKKGGFKNGIK